MKNKLIKNFIFLSLALFFLVLPGLILFHPQNAEGTTALMERLPAYNKFQCILCHDTPSPSYQFAPLNSFGADFRENGMVWNKTLALKNSDGDRCINGFELGDLDGDGVLDEAEQGVHSNPGARDCTIAITYKTWGIIKELFSGE